MTTKEISNGVPPSITRCEQPAIRVLAMPDATNVYGDVFGGWILAQVDIAGAVRALERAQGRVATAAVNHFRFMQPILAGDLVSFYAHVTRVGNTSISVAIEAYAQRYPIHREEIRVAEGTLTYVAVDDEGRPRPVPPESVFAAAVPPEPVPLDLICPKPLPENDG